MIRHSCFPGFIRHSPHPCSSLNYALSLLLKGNFELEPHRLLFLLSLLSSSIGIHQIFKGSCRCMALGHTLKQETLGLCGIGREFAATEWACICFFLRFLRVVLLFSRFVGALSCACWTLAAHARKLHAGPVPWVEQEVIERHETSFTNKRQTKMATRQYFSWG